ncbi:sensor histidine kinase [Methanobacterium alcaliphilum]|uniref:sensor histidine kinase n=1 Tax=Methanobacterium alcaliphilum TaxID=392018 RepID=UPI00200A8BCE|nr:ATP-binding protein [Methanobacterium alcaliphilum]
MVEITKMEKEPVKPFPENGDIKLENFSDKRIKDALRLSKICSIIVITFALIIIIGWVFHIPLLQGIVFDSPPTKFNTSLLFLALGTSLYLLNTRRENKTINTLVKIISIIVFIAGFLTLLQHLFNIYLPFDQFFFQSSVDDLTPTRPRFLSSIIFIFLGIALYLLTAKKYVKYAQIIAFSCALIAYTGFMTYLLDLGSIPNPNIYTQMAFFTSILHIILCTGLLTLYPKEGIMASLHRDSPGSYMGRILLPSSVIILTIIGFFVSKGERAELYNTYFGEVILVGLAVGFLFTIIIWLAHRLNQLDLTRKKFETRIVDMEKFFEDVINGIVEGILVVNKDHKVQYVNNGMLKMFNVQSSYIINKDINNGIITSRMPDFYQYYMQAQEQLKPVFVESIESQLSSGKAYFSGWIIPHVEDEKFNGAIITASDVTITKEAEKLMKASLKEKELLLGEVHHRVKNNMQIISSLLRLQSSEVEDPESRNILLESQNRIKTMSIVHESLYQSENFSEIDMLNYINRLVKNLTITYSSSERVIFQVNSENIQLAIDTAIPVGLVINELVTNAIKHAFPDNRKGKIYIEFKKDPECYQLIVKDDGVGMPADIDLSSCTSLGWELVNGLVDQLSGTLTLNRENGTEITIRFKKIEYSPRL